MRFVNFGVLVAARIQRGGGRGAETKFRKNVTTKTAAKSIVPY